MKTGFYAEGSSDSVGFSGNEAPPKAEVVSAADFYALLKNIHADAPICAYFGEEDRELLMKIESKYGIC